LYILVVALKISSLLLLYVAYLFCLTPMSHVHIWGLFSLLCCVVYVYVVYVMFWCLKPGSPPTTSKIFSSATDVRTLRGRPESTIIRLTVSVSWIRWSTQRGVLLFGTLRLGYFSAHRLTAAAEIPLHSPNSWRVPLCSINVYPTVILESTKTLRTL
jgi:hypothetical protein